MYIILQKGFKIMREIFMFFKIYYEFKQVWLKIVKF